MTTKEDVIKARENLRAIYKKYGDELYGIHKKIDDYLEALQNENKESD